MLVEEFASQRREERLGNSVIQGITGGAHRAHQPGGAEALGEHPRRASGAVIGVAGGAGGFSPHKKPPPRGPLRRILQPHSLRAAGVIPPPQWPAQRPGPGGTVIDHFASFDGTRIAYTDDGIGPAVILLHGYGIDGQQNFGPFDLSRPMLGRTTFLFRDAFGYAPPMPEPPAEGQPGLTAFLRARGCRVIVPDMRGFGRSDKPDDPAAYADSAMARDVVALIEHLDLDRVDVCGFSMGAHNAAKLLALRSPTVRSAVLAGIGDYILQGEAMDLPKEFPLPAHLPRPITLSVHAAEGARLLAAGTIEPGNVLSAHVVMARATGADPKVLAAVLRGTMAEQISPASLAQAAPTLVVNGCNDVVNRTTRQLLAVLRDATAAVCAGDHGTTPFEPSFQQTVYDFLAAQHHGRPLPST